MSKKEKCDYYENEKKSFCIGVISEIEIEIEIEIEKETGHEPPKEKSLVLYFKAKAAGNTKIYLPSYQTEDGYFVVTDGKPRNGRVQLFKVEKTGANIYVSNNLSNLFFMLAFNDNEKSLSFEGHFAGGKNIRKETLQLNNDLFVK